MKIKVCGMCEPGNIAEIARLEPDYMGFIFYDRSPRFAGELDPRALDVLTAETKRVGVFVDAPEKTVREMAGKYGLDLIQLHGDESPAFCHRIREQFQVVKAFGIEKEEDLQAMEAYAGCCDNFLFDTKTPAHGGSGRAFDHRILSAYNGTTPYFLSGGLSPDDVDYLKVFADPRCVAADVNSRFETGPGIKDIFLVKQFIETLNS